MQALTLQHAAEERERQVCLWVQQPMESGGGGCNSRFRQCRYFLTNITGSRGRVNGSCLQVGRPDLPRPLRGEAGLEKRLLVIRLSGRLIWVVLGVGASTLGVRGVAGSDTASHSATACNTTDCQKEQNTTSSQESSVRHKDQGAWENFDI